MVDKMDREALSKLVVYPQNAHFVKTGEGPIILPEKVKERIRKQAANHQKIPGPELILGAVVVGLLAVFLTGNAINILLVTGGGSAKLTLQMIGSVVFFLGLVAISLLVVGILGRNLYDIYHTDLDPEASYLKRLKTGKLIRARVQGVEQLPNGLTHLNYEFDVDMSFMGLSEGKQRSISRAQIEASKIFEEGDDILILHVNNDLYTVL